MRSVHRLTASLLPLASLAAVAACSKAPPARSPLREQLAAAETSNIEQVTRKCLTDEGWKVDDVGSISAGANVVHAFKAKDQTDVYIYPHDQAPRVTGGPDDGDVFWKCLGNALGPASGGDKADKGDKSEPKGDDDKPAAP
jgi:hypothetical protein